MGRLLCRGHVYRRCLLEFWCVPKKAAPGYRPEIIEVCPSWIPLVVPGTASSNDRSGSIFRLHFRSHPGPWPPRRVLPSADRTLPKRLNSGQPGVANSTPLPWRIPDKRSRYFQRSRTDQSLEPQKRVSLLRFWNSEVVWGERLSMSRRRTEYF
jgi:hypothetical protein